MSADEPGPLRSESSNNWLRDLLVVGLLTVGTAGVLWQNLAPRPLVWVLGVPFILLYPGYSWVAAIFPEQAPQSHPDAVRPEEAPSTVARVALSLVLSAILVAAVAALLSPFEAIALGPLLAGVTAVTLAGLGAAVLRRLQLPLHLRGSVPVSGSAGWPRLPGGSVQNVVLFVAVLAFLGVTIAAVAVPPEGEAYTEAYLLSEDDGEYVADDLPGTVTPDETEQFHVGIENHENKLMQYEVVTVVQELDGDGSVVSQRQADQFTVELEDSEEAVRQQEFTVVQDHDNLRLRVLVYEGDAPAEPTVGSADYALGLQLAVEE